MKNLIIMSLAFFALALVGCNRKSDEEKCKEQTNKVWEDGKCKDKPADDGQAEQTAQATKEGCEAVAGKKWVADNKAGEQCVAKTQAECTGANEEWKAAEGDKPAQCAAKTATAAAEVTGYKLVAHSATMAGCTDKLLAGQAGTQYSIVNRIEGRTVVVSSSGTAAATKELAKDACVLVAIVQGDTSLKVTVKAEAADNAQTAKVNESQEAVLCDNTNNTGANANTADNCAAQNVSAQADTSAPAAS